MNKNYQDGLTILEALLVILASVILLWVIVPVVLVRTGYIDAGVMVVTERSKTTDVDNGDLLRSRVDKIEKPMLIEKGLPIVPPVIPAKPFQK